MKFSGLLVKYNDVRFKHIHTAERIAVINAILKQIISYKTFTKLTR